MDQANWIEKLSDLAQLDIDASRAYQEAIDEIAELDIRDSLARFRADHERHIAELSQAIRDLGGAPPSASPDIKGFFLEQFTKIRSQSGTEGALKAMVANEKITNRNYAAARDWDVGPSLRGLIERSYEDERRHLAYVHTALENRIWERPSTQPGQQPFPGQQPGAGL